MRQEDVLFGEGTVRLAGTLVLPVAQGQPPAVVFVHGSGSVTRDLYQVVALHFARHGIAALIYDKRGCGGSTGDWRESSYDDLADDVLAGVQLLTERPDINPHGIGLWGHSQGGWIVPIAAARSPAVAFVIPVSGAGITPTQQEVYHQSNLLRDQGASERTVARSRLLITSISALLRVVPIAALPRRGGWQHMAHAVRFKPLRVWEQVTQPTLALWGDLDRVVPPEQSAALIGAALRHAGNHDYITHIVAHANHRLGSGDADPLATQDVEQFAPAILNVMIDWILERFSPC